MARAKGEPRVVAELGRPETPQETAARKAANTKAYRESQNFRNLLVALGATVVILAVMFLIVPRGDLTQARQIDVAEEAAAASSAFDRTVIVPDVPEPEGRDGNGWFVNEAKVVSDSSWEVLYVPGDDSFLRFVQGFDADEVWAAQRLGGSAPTDELEIGGVDWAVYEVRPTDEGATAGVTYALGTQAGSDHILLYGSSTPETTAEVAEMIAPQVRALAEESR
ncbi:DUF4245 family protein [Microbacterium stercoris]|uniref:DUF4245 family protein n=1 Tax=Microbacterium stercoris TaxID=2820289 RepID=A0A939QNZ9_9MICO|nr:DUF4245 family protein [Microbacterium stercoris]MBO3662243.1 DUF4245 family protein [Microbacterium stercoris]